ncbi:MULTISPECIES: GAF domain-containing protein [unclassified Streptomyces]|uniref:GAF domain-containing protein n=1 Tax=unclassified Streptomyces TaxID=2593676 RepID=UPI0032448C8F
MPDKSSENMNTALRYIAGRKAAEEALGFLAHVSATVQKTTALKDVVPAVAKACVPFLASGASLGALATHSQLVVQSPTEFSAALEELRALAEERGAEPLVISTHEALVKKADPHHLDLLRQWNAGSALALPLDYRGVRGGHLVLVRGDKHRRGAFSPGDVALTTEVADKVAAFNAFATHREEG